MSVRKMSVIAIFSAMAVVSNMLIRFPIIPAVGFLQYDPKDIIIVIAGFIYGPLTSLVMSALCSVLELLYRGGTYIDVIMNMISTCSFACTAAFIYKRFRTKKGAITGLISGILVCVLCMTLWNYVVTPGYYKLPRETVVSLMLPGIIPFNLIKASINASISLIFYKPIVNILRNTTLLEPKKEKEKISIWIILVGLFILLTIILVIYVLNNGK